MNEYQRTIVEPYHCPQCGSTNISYYEEIDQYWLIRGTADDGTVLIANDRYEYSDADGCNARFSCYNCNHSWPATDVKHDFVWSDECAYADDFEPVDFMSDAEADADVLRSAGMGTDEDYGYYGDN